MYNHLSVCVCVRVCVTVRVCHCVVHNGLLLCQVSQEDIENIVFLCDQIIEITDYRTQLYDYLKNR